MDEQSLPVILQSALRQSVGGILVVDAQGKTLFANEAARRMSAGRACYATGTEMPPDEWALSRALHGETIACQEQRLIWPDGTVAQTLVSGTPLRDENQAICGAILTYLDITEQQRAEERMLFEKLAVQQTHEPVIGRLLDGTIVAWNSSAERVYGYTAEEALGQPISMLFTPGFEDEQERLVEALLQGQQFVSIETQRRHKVGHILDVALTASPVRNSRGTVVGMLAVSRDITAQKQTERELRVTHNRLQRLIESEVIGVGISDADGRIFEANDYYLGLLGYTRSEFEQGVSWRAHTPPEYLPVDEKAIAELLQDGVCKPYEKEYIRTDGRRVWVLLVAALLPEEDNRIMAFLLDISAQKRADETIAAQANLLEQTQDAILVWDWDNRIVNWYDGATRLYGWSRTETIGQDIHELLHTTPSVPWLEIVSAIRTHGEWSGELNQVTKNGRQVIVESHMKLVSYGRFPQLILEVNHDVTERKWVEQIAAQTYAKVLEQRRKQNVIFGALPVGVVVADHDGRITEINDRFKQIWGASPPVNSIEQYDIFRGWYPETGKPFAAEEWALARAIRNGEVTTGEVVEIERFDDGRRLTILNSAAPIRNDQGEIVGGVVAIADITERKQMEQALRASEERLRTVLEKMPVLMIAVDEQNLFLRWNKECERVTGYSDEEIIGNPQALALLIPDPDYRAKTLAEVAALGGNYRNYEQRYMAKDGTPRTISWSNISSRFPVPGWYNWAVGVDITERKLAEHQQFELRAQRERVQIMTDFVRDISHDFKTPISTINTSLYLLQRLPDPEKQKWHVSVIQRQVMRLNDLMEGLLTMTRLDDTSGIKTHRVSINQIVLDVRTRILSMAAPKNIQVQVELAENDLFILGDESELGKALIELAENAVQYTLNEGRVTLRTWQIDSQSDPQSNSQVNPQAVIEIDDTGIGIPEADLPKIFERLYRVDKARATDTGGIGLGLAIAQKIVQLHGGIIQVESALGQGSLFRVLLPLAAPDPPFFP